MGKLRASSSILVPNATLSALIKAGQGDEYARKVLESMQAAQRAVLSGDVASNGQVAQDWQRATVSDVHIEAGFDYVAGGDIDFFFDGVAPVVSSQQLAGTLRNGLPSFLLLFSLVANFAVDDLYDLSLAFFDDDVSNFSLHFVATGDTMQEDEEFSPSLVLDEGPYESEGVYYVSIRSKADKTGSSAHWDSLRMSLVNDYTGQTIIQDLTFNF